MRTINQLLLGQLNRNIVPVPVHVLYGSSNGERIAGTTAKLIYCIQEVAGFVGRGLQGLRGQGLGGWGGGGLRRLGFWD